MTSLRELITHEESVLAGSARLRGIHADAVKRGRAAVTALLDEAGDVDEAEERLDRLYADALGEYAARAVGEVSEAETVAWRELASGLSGHAWQELLRTQGSPGAARLLEAMDLARHRPAKPGALDTALAAAARTCVCGYAKTGTMPKRLCQPCANAVSSAWVAEENSLLQRAAGLRVEVERILDDAAAEIADARAIGTDDSYSTEEAILFNTRRKLARANRRHRAETSLLDLGRWRELAQLVRRASMPLMSAEARRARRRLGMAQLARLAVRGSNEVRARNSASARQRGTS